MATSTASTASTPAVPTAPIQNNPITVTINGQRVNFTNQLVVTIDSATFTANGAKHTLDIPAQIIGGSTMLPIRAVLESVGYSLDWNENSRIVIITSN